ncbi:MAG: hypothetical protein VSS75_014130 [Candidatus Parabeggiatoa sp.]|nr:hypothetical protein [Candidatus Parabeggiatoa sp.]
MKSLALLIALALSLLVMPLANASHPTDTTLNGVPGDHFNDCELLNIDEMLFKCKRSFPPFPVTGTFGFKIANGSYMCDGEHSAMGSAIYYWVLTDCTN